MKKLCFACGVEFVQTKGSNHQRFCNLKCRNDYWNKQIVINGKKKIYDSRYRDKYKEEKRQRDSEYKDMVRFNDGSGSKSLNRKATLERDGYRCQKCGCDEYKKLIVHHNSYPAIVEELITLCRSCHFFVHLKLDGRFYPARNSGQEAELV